MKNKTIHPIDSARGHRESLIQYMCGIISGSCLPLLLLPLFLVSCSDDDSYQPGEPTKAGCQQVHFSGTNSESTLMNASDTSDRTISLTVVRNTTQGTLTVPVVLESTSTEGVTASPEVVFADGDSTATLAVTIPDSAKEGQNYKYTVTLQGDEVDNYTLLDGGRSFAGIAIFPQNVTFDFWVYQYTEKWKETAMYLGDGKYLFKNFMHGGVALQLTISDEGTVDLSLPSASLYTEESDYGSCIYWYDLNTDEYLTLYPFGKDGGTVVTYLALLNSATYNLYDAQSNYGYLYVMAYQSAEMAEPAYWTYLYFQKE